MKKLLLFLATVSCNLYSMDVDIAQARAAYLRALTQHVEYGQPESAVLVTRSNLATVFRARLTLFYETACYHNGQNQGPLRILTQNLSSLRRISQQTTAYTTKKKYGEESYTLLVADILKDNPYGSQIQDALCPAGIAK